MIRHNYYYLVAGLPDITIEQGKLQFGTSEYANELRSGLSGKDFELFKLLLLPNDNQLLLQIMLKSDKAVSANGNFDPQWLADEIKEPLHLPKYMMHFIESFQSETRQFSALSPENELATHFYAELCETDNEFLCNWFTFNLDLKNVLLVLSARNHKIAYENQVIGSNEVATLIRKSNARDLGLSAEWPWIEKVLQINGIEDIMAREKAIDQLKWNFLDDQNTFNYFTAEVLMAYYLKLEMIERWLRLDQATGEEMFRRLLSQLQNSYEFPNEFSAKDGRK